MVKKSPRQAKIDDLFLGKKFKVLKEVHLEGDQRFKTPLGLPAQYGFILQEVDNPGNKFPVGAKLLKIAHDSYNAIEDYDTYEAKAKKRKADKRRETIAARRAAKDPSVNVPLPGAEEPLVKDAPTSEPMFLPPAG